jgi:hypothetical protein
MKIIVTAESYRFGEFARNAPKEGQSATGHFLRLHGKSSGGHRQVPIVLWDGDAVALDAEVRRLMPEGVDLVDMRLALEFEGEERPVERRRRDGGTFKERVFHVAKNGFRVLTGPAQELHRARISAAGACERAAEIAAGGDYRAAYLALRSHIAGFARLDLPSDDDSADMSEGPQADAASATPSDTTVSTVPAADTVAAPPDEAPAAGADVEAPAVQVEHEAATPAPGSVNPAPEADAGVEPVYGNGPAAIGTPGGIASTGLVTGEHPAPAGEADAAASEPEAAPNVEAVRPTEPGPMAAPADAVEPAAAEPARAAPRPAMAFGRPGGMLARPGSPVAARTGATPAGLQREAALAARIDPAVPAAISRPGLPAQSPRSSVQEPSEAPSEAPVRLPAEDPEGAAEDAWRAAGARTPVGSAQSAARDEASGETGPRPVGRRSSLGAGEAPPPSVRPAPPPPKVDRRPIGAIGGGFGARRR